MSRFDELGQQHEVELPQGRVRYRERGQGDPIVFVHGVLVNGDLWRGVAPGLARSHRCITPDLPLGSHEQAMRPDADLTPPGLARLLADLLDALDLRDVTLVANDTGGAIAQILVTEHPQRVGRLVLTPCDAFENFLPALFRPLQVLARVPGSMLALAHTLRLRPLQRLPMAFGWLTKRPVEPRAMASYLEPSRRDAGVRRDVGKVLRGIDARHTLRAAERLPGFDRPTLVAWATEDRVFPYEHANRLAGLLPDARVVAVPDSYSFVPEDNPEALVRAIGDFLAQTGDAGGDGDAQAGAATPAAARTTAE